MKKYAIFSLCAWAVLTVSCSSSSDDAVTPVTPVTPTDKSVAVNITTEIQTRTSPAKTEFAASDAMNVWAKSYGSPSATDLVSNIKATRNGSAWTLEPAVYLDAEKTKNAFLYAFYPYAQDNSAAPGQLKIDLSTQTDYMYSGSYVPVTVTTNTGKLTMKHALSLATFNILPQDYSGAGRLQSLALTGDSIYTKGQLTVENGKVRGTEKGELKIAVDKQISATGWTSDMPRIWVIPLPFNTKSTKAYLTAVIDSKEFTATVPEVEMKMGFQYIFHLVLTNNALEFIPEQTTSISLNEDDDQIEAVEGHGLLRLTHNGSELSSLVMQGDNVFGSINWGDGSGDTYENAITHTFATSGSHQVLVETWNSIGFRLRSLEGITTVDVSEYE